MEKLLIAKRTIGFIRQTTGYRDNWKKFYFLIDQISTKFKNIYLSYKQIKKKIVSINLTDSFLFVSQISLIYN